MTTYRCEACGEPFTLPASVRAKYPNWQPRLCLACRRRSKRGTAAAGDGSRPAAAASRPPEAAPEEDPQTGIFTDGACQGNPGPGGWGAVYVRDGRVIEERHGFEPATTNNRMEWTAMIAGLEMAPRDEPITVYSDSQLVVRTLNEWAKGWEARGWKRKDGPVMNLDLVQRAWALKQQLPLVRVAWVRGHATSRWNAYADELATSHFRKDA
ncbi:ribonuclease H family protein [Tepidiforma thermophila]|uniref:ribonuclease H n=1 Tax=Tepidiforma thermophila (strain KCTC 52669 / CGMCC 1.13589 / G233) TaxID=2761530 RepID=A0A2A9HEQ6_TEPT2|nr:ribonuclease H [Tepidiforma thermophila]PFG74278.1 ribonuclease HI [Tepidiforma thermophila]